MKHPILSGQGYKIYSLVWMVIIVVHAAVLFYYYDFELVVAASDSLAYNLLFGAIAPGFWFIVRFASIGEKEYLSLFGTHLSAAIISVFLWAALAAYLLQFVHGSKLEYMDFLRESYVWRLIIGVLFYSITVLMYYLIKYYMDLQLRQNEELELKALLKDSELRLLKSQINPHFIFNSLNSVSALTMAKPDDARKMVIKLSEFLRFSLGKDSTEMNSLKQEVENVSLYLDIEKIRFGERLEFERDISDACGEIEVPNLILQPLFENAVKYGVQESTEKVTIRMTCEQVDDLLQITLSNNFDPEAIPAKGEGIGLENVGKRLALVYGRSDLLEVSQNENNFNVTLRIPNSQIDG